MRIAPQYGYFLNFGQPIMQPGWHYAVRKAVAAARSML